jgi:hypothetical protein
MNSTDGGVATNRCLLALFLVKATGDSEHYRLPQLTRHRYLSVEVGHLEMHFGEDCRTGGACRPIHFHIRSNMPIYILANIYNIHHIHHILPILPYHHNNRITDHMEDQGVRHIGQDPRIFRGSSALLIDGSRRKKGRLIYLLVLLLLAEAAVAQEATTHVGGMEERERPPTIMPMDQ